MNKKKVNDVLRRHELEMGIENSPNWIKVVEAVKQLQADNKRIKRENQKLLIAFLEATGESVGLLIKNTRLSKQNAEYALSILNKEK